MLKSPRVKGPRKQALPSRPKSDIIIFMEIREHDDKTTRCPKMGDFVPFEFCRTCGKPFCWIIIRCWAAKLDIGQFLADNYEPETIQQGLARPEGGRIKAMIETADRYRPDASKKD